MNKEEARWIYKTMNEIREFEDKVHAVSYTHLTLPTTPYV